MKQRLDQAMAARGLVASRSQAESYIKLGQVSVDGSAVGKPGHMVAKTADIRLSAAEQYVSRAALKLASVAAVLGVSFDGKLVLDVGSSTGGFTQYALRHGARRVIAVEVGKDQLHPSLRDEPRIELHEQTDVRELGGRIPIEAPDMVVLDVSFVSLRDILPHVAGLCRPDSEIIAMVKPQFETGLDVYKGALKHKGVIKNDRIRRDILRDFEVWSRNLFVIAGKADSDVAGAKGNLERFYRLRLKSHHGNATL